MYIVRDKKYNTYVAYSNGNLSSDCWSVVRNNANKYHSLAQARKVATYMAKICKIKRNDLVIECLQIKDIVNNDQNCGELKINKKYYLFVEKLTDTDNVEDILIELCDSKECECLCNGLEYVNHTFSSNTTQKELIDYAHKVIKLYEKNN